MVDKRTDITVTPTHKEPYLQGVVFRYSVFAIAFAILTLGIVLLKWWLMVIGLVGFVVGIYDFMQVHHAVLRNYPISGHIRYLLEEFRPELRQYLIEDDQAAVPFSRQQRALAYQRAKNVSDTNAFGTLTPLSTLYNSLILKGLKFNNFLAKNCKPSIYRALEKRVESQVR